MSFKILSMSFFKDHIYVNISEINRINGLPTQEICKTLVNTSQKPMLDHVTSQQKCRSVARAVLCLCVL